MSAIEPRLSPRTGRPVRAYSPRSPGSKPTGRRAAPLEQRFWQFTERRGDNECWPWTGHLSKKGKYAQLSAVVNGRMRNLRGSRVSWELHNGRPVPAGLVVMHSCDNPACVNPHHLSVGTFLENQREIAERRRHHNMRKTHCKRGHELAGENLRLKNNGYRSCRICEKASHKNKNVRTFWSYIVVSYADGSQVAGPFLRREEGRDYIRERGMQYQLKVVRHQKRAFSPSSEAKR